MKKPIGIIAGEPNSISSEIIFKCWKLRKKFIHKPFFVVGSIKLLNLQKKKLKYKIKLKKIDKNFNIIELKKSELPVLDISYNQKKPYEKISSKSNKYIFQCFNQIIKFVKDKKIMGFINCPVSKETLFKNKHQGVTEFLSKKFKIKDSESMLIYNKNLAVSPITTHIPINKVLNNINENKIVTKIKTINNFYRKILKKKPKIAILGLNPHNYSKTKKSKEFIIINKAINKLNKLNINIEGPISPDTAFVVYKRQKFDVIVGMYHDQVLSPFKALFNYDAINITLGLPCIRISPDHGVAHNIMGKQIANSKSLIESIKFFNNIN